MSKEKSLGIITKPLAGEVQTNGATTSGAPVSKPQASSGNTSSGKK